MKKRSLYLFLITIAFAISFSSCKNNKSNSQSSENQTVVVDTHNSQNSIDYEGTYTGTLPCADCSGIYTEITLKGNQYTMKTVYEGKEKDNTFEEKGTFAWDKDGSIITLDEDMLQRYKVGENKLIALDMDGNIITGDLADLYILKKK